MRIVLLTAIYGGYDNLKPLPDGLGFDDAICITDRDELSASGWNIKTIPAGALSPRMAAKLPKLQPFDYVDADIVVWLDGSFEITSELFKQFCLDSLGEWDYVVWSHPDLQERDCLYQEASLCAAWPKYRDYPIAEQVAYYRAQGMPEHFGLWACGTIVWRNNQNAREFGRKWLLENMRWSIQDQVSFPYLVWKDKPNFGVFQAHEYDNPYLVWHRHNSEL